MKKLAILSAAVSAVLSQTVSAAVALDPQSVNAEPFRFIPTLAVEARQDDNIYNASVGEVSSTALMISPMFNLVAQDRQNVYAIRYGIRAGLYEESNNNFVDHTFGVNGHIEPTDRFRFDLGVGYSLLHDDLGTKRTEGTSTATLNTMDPDEYKQTGINGGFEYGAKEATGQIALTAGYNQSRYDTAAAKAQYDMDTLNTQLEFRYRVAPKTKAILDLEYNDGDYDSQATSLVSDYTERNALLGVTWESTANTTGKLRVGEGKRKNPKGTISKPIWDLGVQWSPRDRDQVTFNTMQRFQDGNGGATMESTTYSAGWSHDWLPRLQSSLNASWTKDSYQKSATLPTGRDDDTMKYGAALNYQMRRWLVLGTGVSLKDRSSSLAGFDLDRTVFSLNAQISL